MLVLSEILMFFLSVRNVLMLGALLFCRRLRPRFNVPATVGTILGYFALVNILSDPILPSGALMLFGWLNLSYVLWNLLCWGAFLLAFDVSPGDALFVMTASQAMQHLNYHIIMVFVGVFSWDIETFMFQLIFLLSSVAVYVTFFFLLIRRMDISERLNVDGKSLLLFAVIIILASLVLNQYVMAGYANIVAPPEYHIAMVFGCLCLLMLMLRAFRETKAEYDKKVVETLLRSDQTKQEYSKEAIDLVNRKYHDIRRELAAVRAEGANADRLNALEREVNIYGLIANTGNRVLDALLAEKTLLCDKYGINFTYILDGRDFAFIDSVDLYSMLGNALDNAIEYLSTAPEDKRVMSLGARRRGNALVISLENWFGSELHFVDGLPVTTKDDKRLHGYGSKSIRYIAEKYGGSAVMRVSGDRFVCDIVLLSGEKGEHVSPEKQG